MDRDSETDTEWYTHDLTEKSLEENEIRLRQKINSLFGFFSFRATTCLGKAHKVKQKQSKAKAKAKAIKYVCNAIDKNTDLHLKK